MKKRVSRHTMLSARLHYRRTSHFSRIPLSFEATDEFGEMVRRDITLVVENVFEAPIASTDSISQTLFDITSTDLSFTLPEDLFTDPDGDDLNYRIVQTDGSTPPDWIKIDPDALTIQIDTGQVRNNLTDPGTIELLIVASDPQDLTAEIKWKLDYLPVAAAALEPTLAETVFTDEMVASQVSSVTTTAMPVTAVAPGKPLEDSAPAADASPRTLSTEPTTLARQEASAQFLAPESGTPPDNELALSASVAKPQYHQVAEQQPDRNPPSPVIEHTPQSAPVNVLPPPVETDQQIINEVFNELSGKLNKNKEQLEQVASLDKTIQVTSVALSSGLSVGYIIWLLRGGAVVASMMSSLPAWRFVDPLPVLDNIDDDAENDNESLESLVHHQQSDKHNNHKYIHNNDHYNTDLPAARTAR